jgi:hypothetical protein
MGFQQALVEDIHQVLEAGAVVVPHEDPQLLADGQDELQRGLLRIEDDGHVRVSRHTFQQRTHHRRLARAHLPGELNEAAGLGNAVQEVRQRLRVPLAHEEVARVGSDGERFFA